MCAARGCASATRRSLVERVGAFTITEAKRIAKDEILVVIQLQGHGQIIGRSELRPFAPAGVEQLIRAIQGNGEETLRAPLEGATASVGQRDGGRAVSLEDVEHLLETVLHASGVAALGNVDEKDGSIIAASFQ